MAWFDSNYSKRIKITSQATAITNAISGFVYYFPGSKLPSDFWENVNGVGDIVVTEGEDTRVPAHVVAFADNGSSGTFSLFFKGTTNPSSDKEYYIYFGNPAATEPAVGDTYGRNNVYTAWDSVHHLSESASTDSGHYKDSTGNYDLTATGSPGSSTSGKLEHDGHPLIDHYVRNTSYTYQGGSGSHYITIMGWIKKSTAGDNAGRIWTLSDGSSTRIRFTNSPTADDLSIDKDYSGGSEEETITNSDIESTNWVFVACAFDANFDVGDLRIDGSESAENFNANGLDSDGSDIDRYSIGGPGTAFDGYAQSFFYANADYSSYLVDFYSNQNDPDSFWSVGTVEELFIDTSTAISLGLSLSASPQVVKETAATITLSLVPTVSPQVLKETSTAIPLSLSITASPALGGYIDTSAAISLGLVITASPQVVKETSTAIPLSLSLSASPQVYKETSATIALNLALAAAPEVANYLDTTAPISLGLAISASPQVVKETSTAIPLSLNITAAPALGGFIDTSTAISLGLSLSVSPQVVKETSTEIAFSLALAAAPEVATYVDTSASISLGLALSVSPQAVTDTSVELTLLLAIEISTIGDLACSQIEQLSVSGETLQGSATGENVQLVICE